VQGVLCEKPFARNAAEAERVVEAAERSGRRAIEALHVDNMVFPSQGHSLATDIDGVPRRRTVAVGETYDHQLAAVVDALASGEPLPTKGRDPVCNMRVIDAVYAAAGVPGH
jgi:predicted dehydrogenase